MCRTLNISKEIKLIISDFDGIFTDGTVFVGPAGSTFKQVSYKDIMGVSLALKNGLRVAFVSGEVSPAIDFIANKFCLEDVFQNIRNKKEIVLQLMEKYKLSRDEILYVGDDVNDIESMQLVKYKVTPPNANDKVKELDGIQVTIACGGDGVFREIVDTFIQVKADG